MNIRNLFRGIDTAPESSKHYKEGWVNIKCPYCGKGSSNYLLGFNIQDKYFNCWKEGHKPLFKTFNLLTGITYPEFLETFSKGKETNLNRINKNKGKVKRSNFILPPKSELINNLRVHKKYIKDRGLNPESLKKYNIQGTTHLSRIDNIDLSWRIVIPVYLNGEIVTWQTRSIGYINLPYIACPKKREKVSIKKVLYPEEQSSKIVLTEGLFDVWRVREAGYPGVCCFGTGMSVTQIKLLSKKEIILFFDGDKAGKDEAQKIKDRIEFINNKEVIIAECPEGEDPGGLEKNKIDKILKEYF